jgi:AraC-like DNA-binding protein
MNVNQTVSRQNGVDRSFRALTAWRTNVIFDYVEKNLASRLDFAALSDRIGLSPARLSRAFKCRYGVSLRFYVMCRRVVMAQNLMLMTRDQLKDIALDVGMSDQAHFTRVFHALVGETPGHWRELQRRAYENGELPVPIDTTSNLLRRCDPMETTIDCQALQASRNRARELQTSHAPGEPRCRMSDFRSI